MNEMFKDNTEVIDVTRNGDDEIIDIIIDMPQRFIKKEVILPNREGDWESNNKLGRL